MAIRSIFALALASSMAIPFASDAARPEDQPANAACPGLTANIVFNDYDGTRVIQMCVAPNGLSITGNAVNLHVYDNQADGIFHNGFESAP